MTPSAASSPAGRPDGTLFRAGVVLAACFLWTIILPGAVAYRDNVFFSSGVVSKLAENKNCSTTIREDQDYRFELLDELHELKRHISVSVRAASSEALIKMLIDAKDKTEEDLRNFKPRIKISGSYDNSVNVVFLLNYLALACLVFMMPSGTPQISQWRAFAIGLTAYLMFTWPNFLRNFLFNQYFGEAYEKGRTVFAYAHWDIDHASFIFQEIRMFVMIWLLSVLWQRWSLYASKRNLSTRGWAAEPIKTIKSAERAVIVSEQLSRWQSHSLLLTMALGHGFIGLRLPI